MKQYDFSIKGFHDKYVGLVDEQIQAALPGSINGLKRVLSVHGKRLRPGIVVAVAYYSGQPVDASVIKVAAAVELVHLASLIHDDIIDDGSLRHGEPTIHAREGMDHAILAGDYLLAKACYLSASISAEAGVMVADAIMKLCEGQAVELQDTRNLGRSIHSLQMAIRGKTSSLFTLSVQLGSIVSGLPATELACLADFADNFGIAFQYMDDVHDFIQPVETAGKTVGNDVREGKYTLPVLLSLQGPQGSELKRLLAENVSASRVLELLQKDGSINQTIQEAENYKQQAAAALSRLANHELANVLHGTLALI